MQVVMPINHSNSKELRVHHKEVRRPMDKKRIVRRIIVSTLIAVVLVSSVLVGIEVYKIITPSVSLKFPDIVQKTIPSVVHVQCPQWQGSGVAFTKDIIVTAHHIIDGVDYTITLNDGTVVKGIQAISHKKYDIGFIKVDKPILKPAKFGRIKDCVLGQHIFIIGSPYGKQCFNNVTLGIISNVNPSWDFANPRTGESYGWSVTFLSDSAAHPGNSGGPVFTMGGVVRGLLGGGISPGLNCSIPCDLFIRDRNIINELFALDVYEVKPSRENTGFLESVVVNME